MKNIAFLAFVSLIMASCKPPAPSSAQQETPPAAAQKAATAQTPAEQTPAEQAPDATESDQTPTNVHGLMIDDLDGDGNICFPEIMQAYVNWVDNSGVTPTTVGNYDVQTWEKEQIQLPPELAPPNGTGYYDASYHNYMVFDSTVIVGRLAAYRNILDPDDYRVDLRVGDFLEKTFMSAMCAETLKLPEIPVRHLNTRGWSAWNTPGGTIYGSKDNKGGYSFYSATYFEGIQPQAYYQWQPLLNAVPN